MHSSITITVKSIVDKFLNCLDELRSKGIFTETKLEKYSDYNVHSFLQYCLIVSAHHLDLLGVPEYKLRLSTPIDRHSLDSRFKNRRGRYTRTIRVDVGFLEEGRLIGIGEIYTPDEIHGCLPSNKLEGSWLTPYHKLIHISEHEKHIEFMILVIGLWTLPPWKDARKKEIQEWYRCWKKLVEQISSKKPVGAMYIKGLNNIETTLK